MRFIKLIVVSAVVLFGLLTAISLLFPSHLRVSRAINVAASRQRVYGAVNDLKTWDQWNQFIRTIPLTGRSFTDPSSGKGATLRSDQLLVTISESSPDSVIMDWQQIRGKRFTGGFNLLQLSSDSLTVQWWFDFHFRWYPWEKMGSLVYDKKLGPIMEESLSGLKQFVENVQ
ncbi:SRPBCC family protein [Flavitalea flava]